MPSNTAVPETISHPYSPASSMYLFARSCATSASLPAIRPGKSSGTAAAPRPGNRSAAAAAWRASAAASNVFDGTHPTFTQVPPTVSRSIITTDLPWPTAAIAAANAAEPDPTIARSGRDCVVATPAS
ncbi:Uncharacterised protein [Mycobacteroides abscessus subsp. abscessus]|nr:Uncharacterised protein [Mycobacteroides abscessus subsp. abscessus]